MSANVNDIVKKTAADALTIAINEGSLKGTTYKVANKIMSDYSEALSKITIDNMKTGLEELVRLSVQKIATAICTKVAMGLSVFVGVIGIITLIAGGNIVIPLVISAIFIGLIWLMAKIGSIIIARNMAKATTHLIFKAIEDVVARYSSG